MQHDHHKNRTWGHHGKALCRSHCQDRQSRVGICEEIEVIAVVEEISGRIPTKIGIRLGEPTLVAALVDALLMAVTGRVAALTV